MARRTLLISLACALLLCTESEAQTRGTTHSFRFENAPLRAALDSLLRWYDVPLVYLEKDVEGLTVTADCRACTFEEALREVLAGKGLFALMVGEQVLLQVRRGGAEPARAILAGTVTDSLTREPLIGASVALRNVGSEQIIRWGLTNEFGFFSLTRIEPGIYSLEIRSIGYTTRVQRLTIAEGSSTVTAFALEPRAYLLPEVIIEGERSALAAAEGLSRGIFIRSTPTDQNQYFLEGTRIYNPQHYGGVMTTFNADALRDVQVVAGGVPPFYGGRIGGILDVTLRNGNSDGLSGTAQIGSLASTFSVDGPLDDFTSFIVSGRRSYPNILLTQRDETEPSDLRSLELLTKVSHGLSGNGRLSLSAYIGRDTYQRTVGDRAGQELANDFRWGNTTAHIRWVDVLSPSLFVHASAGYTRYGFDVNQRRSGPYSVEPSFSRYAIEDVSLRAHAEYFYDDQHTMRSGVELVHHRMEGTISEFSSQLAPLSLDGFAPWELSIYLQDQWRLIPSVTAELGGRATSFVGRQGTFSALDPRFALLVNLDDNLRLYSSFSAVTQFVHPYRNSGLFLFTPTVFYYPSTTRVRPTTSLLLSLGLVKNTDDHRYTFAVEGYYRVTQKLHEFVFDTTRYLPVEITDAVLFGEGTVYGGEVTITRRTGSVMGILRYSLSLARNRFSEINDGRPYTPRFNRTHELYLSLSYFPKDDWMFGVLCLLSSNPSPKLAPEPPQTEAPVVSTKIREVSTEFTRYTDHVDLNGGRLPGFQRLEFRIAHSFDVGALPCQASLRMVNGYGIADPFVWEISNNSDERLRWRAKLEAPDLFPLYPVLSVGVRF